MSGHGASSAASHRTVLGIVKHSGAFAEYLTLLSAGELSAFASGCRAGQGLCAAPAGHSPAAEEQGYAPSRNTRAATRAARRKSLCNMRTYRSELKLGLGLFHLFL